MNDPGHAREGWLSLCRFGRDGAGTWGRLEVPHHATYFTAEPPWRFNQPFISCIPDGDYLLERHATAAKPLSWAIVGNTVSRWESAYLPRYTCLLEIANWPHQVRGCAGVGLSIGMIGGEMAVMDSREAMKTLDAYLQGIEPRIQIYSAF
jgi:hypothetical protein